MKYIRPFILIACGVAGSLLNGFNVEHSLFQKNLTTYAPYALTASAIGIVSWCAYKALQPKNLLLAQPRKSEQRLFDGSELPHAIVRTQKHTPLKSLHHRYHEESYDTAALSRQHNISVMGELPSASSSVNVLPQNLGYSYENVEDGKTRAHYAAQYGVTPGGPDPISPSHPPAVTTSPITSTLPPSTSNLAGPSTAPSVSNLTSAPAPSSPHSTVVAQSMPRTITTTNTHVSLISPEDEKKRIAHIFSTHSCTADCIHGTRHATCDALLNLLKASIDKVATGNAEAQSDSGNFTEENTTLYKLLVTPNVTGIDKEVQKLLINDAIQGYNILKSLYDNHETVPATSHAVKQSTLYKLYVGMRKVNHTIQECTIVLPDASADHKWLMSNMLKHPSASTHFYYDNSDPDISNFSTNRHYHIGLGEGIAGKKTILFGNLKNKNSFERFFVKPEKASTTGETLIEKIVEPIKHTKDLAKSLLRKATLLRKCYNYVVQSWWIPRKVQQWLYIKPDDHYSYKKERLPEDIVDAFTSMMAITKLTNEQNYDKHRATYEGISYMYEHVTELLKQQNTPECHKTLYISFLNYLKLRYDPKSLLVRKGNEIVLFKEDILAPLPAWWSEASK